VQRHGQGTVLFHVGFGRRIGCHRGVALGRHREIHRCLSIGISSATFPSPNRIRKTADNRSYVNYIHLHAQNIPIPRLRWSAWEWAPLVPRCWLWWPRWSLRAARPGSRALQLCGDAGGVLGPIVGTTLTVGGHSTPYLVCAGVLSVVLPVAVWLARLERRAAGPAVGGTPLLNRPTVD